MKLTPLPPILWLLVTLLAMPLARGQTPWSRVDSPTTRDLWGVTFGGGVFVAVGDAGTILSSTDGGTWTVRNSGSPRWLLAVAWSPALNLFVAAGDAGTVLTSADGVNWTPRNSATTQRLNGIAWGGDRFLAIGEMGAAVSSVDGATWIPRATGDTGWLRGIAYGNGVFVVTGHDGTILTTTDGGATFRRRGIATSGGLEAAVFAGDRWWVAGAGPTGGDPTVASSDDLAYWQKNVVLFGSKSILRGLALQDFTVISAGDRNVPINQVGSTLSSDSALVADWRSVAAGPTRAVVVGIGGAIASAPEDPSLGTSVGVSMTDDSALYIGGHATFVASVIGTRTVTWQWNFKGVPITGATSATLRLDNLTLDHVGNYGVTAQIGARTFAGMATLPRVSTSPPTLGLVDPTFKPTLPTLPELVSALPDGRIYVAASAVFFENQGRLQHGLARLRVDGSVDPTFNPGSGIDADGAIRSLFLQRDGRLVVRGTFSTFNGVALPKLARLNADGTVDRTFQPDAGLRDAISVVPLPDGRWLGIGTPQDFGAVTRFRSDGALDATLPALFSTPSKNLFVTSYAFDAADRVYVAIEFVIGPPIVGSLIRLQSDGARDPSFSSPSYGGPVTSLATTDRGVLAGSQFTDAGKAGGTTIVGISRVNNDGLRDPSFSTPSYVLVFPQPDPRSVAFGFGSFVTSVDNSVYTTVDGTQGRTGIVRLTATGAIDRDFDAGLSVFSGNGSLPFSTDITPLPNGQLLIRRQTVNGVATHNLARLTPNRAAATTRLSNISIRARAGSDAQTLIVGYVVANGEKAVLARGAGPALASFGITNALDDPQLTVFRGATPVADNDNWPATLADAAVRVGAFAFDAGSRDAALLTQNAAAAYTVQVTGKAGATGVALAELYDTDPRPPNATAPRIVNFSARTTAGIGADTLIAGFSIDGDNTRTVLIRAIGPTLGSFGVAGALADPVLTLYRGQTVLATNDNWADPRTGENPSIGDPAARLAEAFRTVGAFMLEVASKDAALLVTLAPGSYTAQVSGAGATTGVALLEVYEIP